ncbi:Fe-S cluster assembly sulfur transfer protein SufU [Anaerotignum sp.]|uniref:Fe-S cluster assembly sulfur transfer protein SufU n=1 Tax=Anaerotignum sp. TaxID=2039241 RepID=UPI00289FB816|nr:SUF system NifU family Fe-S cluster assembly protein [Anaerotignum sp.]
MDLSEIYTEVIAEHSVSTKNKREMEKPDFVMEGVNPSCGDELAIAVKFSGTTIEDIAFTGSGCAISQASASIMADLLRGKSLEEAQSLTTLFLSMIKREITEDASLEALEEAVALKNISNMPARVKCAVLAWHTVQEVIEKRAGDQQ